MNSRYDKYLPNLSPQEKFRRREYDLLPEPERLLNINSGISMPERKRRKKYFMNFQDSGYLYEATPLPSSLQLIEDEIEKQLRLKLAKTDYNAIDIRRRELRRLFNLVPSDEALNLLNRLNSRTDKLGQLFRGEL